jgi:hypothetical protein
MKTKTERIYIVDQTLCKERQVMVEAANQEEAMERAKQGYGEVIEQDRDWKLLCATAARS